MIKKIPLPQKYHFLLNKKFISKLFQKEIKIEKIKTDAIKMGGVLKIFIRYLIFLDGKKKSLHAIYRFSGSREREFEVLKYLSNYKFKNSHFLTPKPLFYFKKERVLIYEDVSGKPLSDLPLKKILHLLKDKISLLVNSLVSLQKTNPPVPKYNFKKEEIKAKKFEKEFLKFLPESRDLIKKTIFKIFKKKKFYLNKNTSSFFTHNDLTFGNLIWGKNSFGLIDFSESCRYDPFTDLGTFLAQLDYLNFKLGVLPAKVFIKNLQKEYIKKYIVSLKKEALFKNKLFLVDWGKRLALYRAWGNLQNAIFVLGAEEKFQNPQGCLWFLKLSNDLLKESNCPKI